jgi:FixJ family two-component response regulator
MVELDTFNRVVIIDDERVVSEVLQDSLKERFDVTCFLDPDSVLHELPPTQKPIIFVIDDLPGNEGSLLRKKLEPRFPRARYILKIGRIGIYGDDRAERSRSAGFDALVTTPFRILTLIQTIDSLAEIQPPQSS